MENTNAPAPRGPAQIILTEQPDGTVGVRVANSTDRTLLTRMLAAAILTLQEQRVPPPRPSLVLPGVRLPNGATV